MESLQENNTWEVTKLPQNKRAIKCKWVYRVKENPDGSVNKHKARLVVKGFSQQQGVHYNSTFSPVAKWGTIHAAISTGAMERMWMSQFGVSTAFLYGSLEETIYMSQPEGFSNGTNRACKLRRSL
jgi:hypothetical protein